MRTNIDKDIEKIISNQTETGLAEDMQYLKDKVESFGLFEAISQAYVNADTTERAAMDKILAITMGRTMEEIVDYVKGPSPMSISEFSALLKKRA